MLGTKTRCSRRAGGSGLGPEVIDTNDRAKETRLGARSGFGLAGCFS